MPISNLSSGLRPGVCTSTTRPTTPFEGQMIYETDTDKVLVWNGSAWYANWNLPWGLIGSSELSVGTVASGNPATITSVTLTHVANRKLRISAFGRINFSSSTNTATELRDAGTRVAYWDYPSTDKQNIIISAIVSSSASSKTYDVRIWQGSTVTLTVAEGKYFLTVEDIGPA